MQGTWLTRLLASMGIMVASLCALGCGANNALPHPVPKVPAVGTLTFVNSSNPPTVVNPSTVQVADFKGNGKLDLAVASFGVSGGSVLLGNGDATFTAGAPFPVTGNDINNAVVADFNADGKLDLAIDLCYLNEVQILLGNGDGTFTPMPPITIPEGVDYLATGDFNGDGKADLVALSDSSDGLTVLLGNGDGTFAAVAAHPAAGYHILDVLIGDFNGDGTLDLAVETYAPGPQISVAILLGNGDGTFKSGQVLPFPNGSSYLVVADFNGDGILDLAGSNYVGGNCAGSGSVLVLLGKGDGSFAPAAISPSAGSCPGPIAVGDFNGDGIADMVVLDSDNTITVLLGNGDGTFAAPLNFSAGPESVIVDDPVFLTVGDFNGDGVTDVAIADNGTNSVAILLAQWTPSAAGAASAARH